MTNNDCPTNINSDNNVTPLEIDNNYTPYDDTPFNNMGNPGYKVTYRTPIKWGKCLLFIFFLFIGILSFGLLTLGFIQSKNPGFFFGFAFMIVWTGVFLCYFGCQILYISITIDPLNGIFIVKTFKVGCCFNSKKYDINNLKKIIVKLAGVRIIKEVQYYLFDVTMILKNNQAVDILSGLTDKDNEKRKFVDILRKSLPNYIQLEGNLK